MIGLKSFVALALLGACASACKVDNASQTLESRSNVIVSRPNCYTAVTVAELGTKHAGAQDLKVFYANGNCHGFRGGQHEQKTLDRYALTSRVFVSTRELDGKKFAEAKADVRKLCLVGKSVVAAKDCETASASDQLIGTVDTLEIGRSIRFDAAKIAFDISYNGAAVDKDTARRVGMEKINLWVSLK